MVFLLVYIALLIGFSLAFHVILANDLDDFSTATQAVVTLFRMAIGDFEYHNFSRRGESSVHWSTSPPLLTRLHPPAIS
jgi:Polycystin cation channel